LYTIPALSSREGLSATYFLAINPTLPNFTK
jgi:hypothetical protein